jgi:hypothetical protein
VNNVSETIRVKKNTKQALLRVATRLQEQTGRRVNFDEAISHLVHLEDTKEPEFFEKFVGSASAKRVSADELLRELRRERSADERRAKRKYGL